MVWMETYLFYCSVRLGVVVVGVLTFLQLLIPAILLFSFGIEIVDPVVNLFRNDGNYKRSFFVRKVVDWLENYPHNLTVVIHVYLFFHMATTLSAIYGSLKLRKWFLVPFIIIELVRVIYCLLDHIILMIVLKKILNLGLLIAVTLAGGFIILYLAYNWATAVAMFQIIGLINSTRYKALYGDDPFNPHSYPQKDFYPPYAYGTIENVRVLVTPQDPEKKPQNPIITRTPPRPIISVLPARYSNNNNNNHNNINHYGYNPEYQLPVFKQTPWWKRQNHITPPAPVRIPAPKQSLKMYNKNITQYDYWQRSELPRIRRMQ